MKKFIFTTKGGSEAINTIEKITILEATAHFAKIKNLPIACFTTLYDVKEKK